MKKKKEWTYHFVIDFMKMNFTDFLYDVFTLKSYETKSYAERNRGGGGRGGGREEKEGEDELVESLNKNSSDEKKNAPQDGILSGARSRNYAGTSVEIGLGMEENK